MTKPTLESITPCLPAGQGMFIIMEGLDGSGKTTACQTLCDAINAGLRSQLGTDANYIYTTHEPGGTPFATDLREVFLRHAGDTSAVTQTFLINAARADHVEKVIRPAIADGKIVICDRFTLSTYLYQFEMSIEDHLVLESFSSPDLMPDLAIVMTVRPEVSQQRTISRGNTNYFDEQHMSKLIARADRLNELMSMVASSELPIAYNCVGVDANDDLPTVIRHLNDVADAIITQVMNRPHTEEWCDPDDSNV